MTRPTPTHDPARLVTIVIPAKDEELAIGTTLRALPISTLKARGYACEVVVLDGRSLDSTARIAKQWGATVIVDKGRGKGAALRDARPHLHGRYIIMLDADGTYAPDAIPSVLDQLTRGESDVVMGIRSVQTGAMSGTHRAGNAMLSLGASTLYGTVCRDLCTGLWGFKDTALQALPLQAQGFELEAELFALSRRMDLRISNVRVDYLPRKGESKLGTVDGLKIAWCLIRTRFITMPATNMPDLIAQPDGSLRQEAPAIAPQPMLPALDAGTPDVPDLLSQLDMPAPATSRGLAPIGLGASDRGDQPELPELYGGPSPRAVPTPVGRAPRPEPHTHSLRPERVNLARPKRTTRTVKGAKRLLDAAPGTTRPDRRKLTRDAQHRHANQDRVGA